MPDLDALLGPDRVLLDVKATSKRQILRAAAEATSRSLVVPQDRVLTALMERERLGSTGVGNGLAIPHAKLDGLDAVAGLFLRADQPVDFEAPDNRPVDLLFVLLAPGQAGADHLKALAKVSRVFRNPNLCTALRKALSVREVLRLLGGQASG